MLRWGDFEGNYMFMTLGGFAIASCLGAYVCSPCLLGCRSQLPTACFRSRCWLGCYSFCWLRSVLQNAMQPGVGAAVGKLPHGRACPGLQREGSSTTALRTLCSLLPPLVAPAGNLLLSPACSLLFLDFRGGDALLLRGQGQVLHKDRQLPGAQVRA